VSVIEKAIDKLGADAKLPLAQTQELVDGRLNPALDPAQDGAQQVPQTEGTAGKAKRTIDIDFRRLRAEGILTPDAEDGNLAEEMRRIKRPLLNNAFGSSATLVENGNVIMVTSAVPGEGKTFMSISLAVSMAMEVDKSVLLVDADVMRWSSTKLLDDHGELGLLDAVANPRLEIGDAIVHTNMPRLTFLPAGGKRGRATELLASDSMRSLVQQLAAGYSDRIILFDSPPLLAATEASVLSSLMGQIVLVVEAEKTHQSHVKDALDLLDQNKPIGLILNKSRSKPRSGYYGYYYGYGSKKHEKE
jgi:receptor protein-tyrosine kinase